MLFVLLKLHSKQGYVRDNLLLLECVCYTMSSCHACATAGILTNNSDVLNTYRTDAFKHSSILRYMCVFLKIG